MQGKRIDKDILCNTLREYLKDENHLLCGYGFSEGHITHRIYKGNLEGFALFNPFFSFNSATLFSRVFAKGVKVLLLMRPCEIRAFIELIKLNQIEKESFIAISMDCPGTVSLKVKKGGLTDDPFEARDYLKENNSELRWACSVCRERRGVIGDAGIRMTEDGGLWIFPYTDNGASFLEGIGKDLENCEKGFLLKEEKVSDVFTTDMKTFSSDLSTCILCKNCRDMCPVCYCVDCLFNGDEYLPKGDAFLNKIMRIGTTDVPDGRALFHMVRLFHVSQTCVGCGGCEEACPQGIPLTRYFKGISERLQAIFFYMSGRDINEVIPYLTFNEDELKDAAD